MLNNHDYITKLNRVSYLFIYLSIVNIKYFVYLFKSIFLSIYILEKENIRY